MTGATFLLGVGCQKGGTTWLDAYLRDAPEVAAGFLKEYHLWDVLDLPSAGHLRQRIETAAAAGDANAQRRVGFWADPESAIDYFAELLAPPQVSLATDITPAYAALSVERLTWLREQFSRRGIDTRTVFLMRDPVERIWSAVRMHVRDNGGASAEERVLASYAGDFHDQRTRYDRTIAALDQAFDEDATHYGFYEELFTDDSVRSLCTFLGIAFRAPDFDRRLNASPKAAEISDETVRRVATHYREVYVSVAERFGVERVRALWPSSVHVLA